MLACFMVFYISSVMASSVAKISKILLKLLIFSHMSALF